MELRESRENLFPTPGEGDNDDSAIGAALRATNESILYGALDQADNGVVSLLEEFGELGDGGRVAAGVAGHAEH